MLIDTDTVLVVDDDRNICDSLRRTLARKTCEVFTTTNPLEVMDITRQRQPDLILLDLNMPDLNGLHLLYKLRTNRETEDIPVMFLSGCDDYRDKLATLQNGAVDWLQKPIDPTELKARVSTHLRLRRLQREKAAAQEALLKEQRQFAGMLAHDLRAPLTIVQGTLELLRDSSTDPEIEELRDRAESRVIQMISMIERNLSPQLISGGVVTSHLNTADISALVRDLVAGHQLPAKRKNISLNFQSLTEEFSSQIDVLRIQEILDNLISNAIKYSFSNCSVTVNLTKFSNKFAISVSDNGQGIPADQVELLFVEPERVSTLPTAGERSTKLGLSIVKKLVSLLGGSISVTSSIGEETTFTVELPIID